MAIKPPEEWLQQADYDLKIAKHMFKGGSNIYTVFMCHLSIEKVLKGIYTKIIIEIPPKTHNLLYLINKIGIQLPEFLYNFVFELNRVSIPTRYPDDLKRMFKEYNKSRTKEILEKSEEVIKWLKREFEKQ